MPEDPPEDDDDVLVLIERTRAQLAATSARQNVTRQSERRGQDRRALGWAARRDGDADLNQQRRAFLLAYLRRLPYEMLWYWIDGLLLGTATDAQLAALMQAATQSSSTVPTGPRRVGRPPEDGLLPHVHPLLNGSIRYEWRVLRSQLKAFSDARRQHHARMNRTRAGAPRSLARRTTCLASPMGQRVDRAELFAEFFDQTHLIPSQMAARLLHREAERSYAGLAASDAAKAAGLRRKLGSWRTLYDKLRQRSRPR